MYISENPAEALAEMVKGLPTTIIHKLKGRTMAGDCDGCKYFHNPDSHPWGVCIREGVLSRETARYRTGDRNC